MSTYSLVSERFEGAVRSKVMGYQQAFVSLMGFVALPASGHLGDSYGWHAPFGLYLSALVMLPIALATVPRGGAIAPQGPSRGASSGGGSIKALIPIYILGLGAPQSVQGTLVATVLMLIVTVWGFFIHANIRWRLGPLEWLVATPGFHHWHHVRSEFRNCNYASMLPCWDWIFGTHHLPKHWPEAYGIDAKLPSSVAGQLLYPLQPSSVNLPPESARISSSSS